MRSHGRPCEWGQELGVAGRPLGVWGLDSQPAGALGLDVRCGWEGGASGFSHLVFPFQ